MNHYKLTFNIAFKLSAKDHVNVKDRLERDLQSYSDERSIKAILREEG